MAPGSRHGKVRPSDVAADTKKNFINMINREYSQLFPPYSVLYHHPKSQIELQRRTYSTRPPMFVVETGDPVSRAIEWGMMDGQSDEASGRNRINIPFICAANERRAGGDWETSCAGYEEKLCRRSNLSATLKSPLPGTNVSSHYPIPSGGGIFSSSVVVYRGEAEHYHRYDRWFDMPVISVPPTRWPKLKDNGTKYSFSEEREMMREKMGGALRICLYNGYNRVVIGDFGLGNGHRNPPQEVAEIWRDLFLFDPDLRGQFAYVSFIFDDPSQSTARLIVDELTKKASKSSSSKSRHRSSGDSTSSSRTSGSSGSSSSRTSSSSVTDIRIFEQVFDQMEIERVLSRPDPRYSLETITHGDE
ncbi:unnamed protein product [Clonostachys rhizophaga]|uniref:Microbial-type PARG catalytic domain-containing protein n=1 Tax=Clonostachys rhizophaga TaxID=160324 RepID=A0A9N9V8S7_9HYPO|nr:unnamed protein product [Clonostachys rhizophaga]